MCENMNLDRHTWFQKDSDDTINEQSCKLIKQHELAF